MNLTGIQFRLLLLAIIPTFLLVTSLAYYFIQHHYLDLENVLKNKGQVTTNQLAISSIYGVFSANTEVLNEITKGLMDDPDIVSVHILDSLGNSLAQSEQATLPPEHELVYFQHPVTIHTLKQTSDEANISSFDQSPHPLPAKIIGAVKVTLSLQNTHKKQKVYLLNSLLMTFTGIIFTILLALRLSKTISQPIINLTKKANDLANGKMDARAKASNTSEINLLCQSFNTMAERLQGTQNNLMQQIDLAVKELNTTLASLEEKNQSLEKSSQLAINQNKTKSQFLAHISHEIRTPMNGILGFIELLTKSKLSLQQSDQAQLIKSSASSLLTIVNEILDYSSLETGNFKIHISNFSLRENIENCVTTIIPVSDKVQVIIDIDNNIPDLISTDPLRLQQLITNLLGNACKFTHQGHILVRCHLLKNNSLFISISDTGAGIHKDQIDDLFQPFLQTSEYAVNNELGTGLGLTICKNIIKRLGGKLGVCTQINIGSTFWFHIPVALASAEQPPITQQHTILLIDNFKPRRKAFIKQLSHLGFNSTAVSSIPQLSSHQGNKYTVIFYADENNKTHDIKSITSRLQLFSIEGRIIFLGTHKKALSKNVLPLPCRSSYLKNLINTCNETKPSLPSPEFTSPDNYPEKNSFSIFIADDNEINRLLLKSQLETYCKNITLADNGKEALSYLQSNKYDLIFLDLQMPYFSGQDLIKIIKQSDSINKDSPVIAITAHAQSHQRKTLIESGFDECLIKPVLLEPLSEILDLWLTDDRIVADDKTDKINYVAKLMEKTSGNSDLAATIFNKLFKELEQQSQSIEHALETNNFALAEKIAHKLHGSVSFCGFTDIQTLAKAMEISLSKKDTSQITTNFHRLKNKIITFLALKNSINNQLSKLTRHVTDKS